MCGPGVDYDEVDIPWRSAFGISIAWVVFCSATSGLSSGLSSDLLDTLTSNVQYLRERRIYIRVSKVQKQTRGGWVVGWRRRARAGGRWLTYSSKRHSTPLGTRMIRDCCRFFFNTCGQTTAVMGLFSRLLAVLVPSYIPRIGSPLQPIRNTRSIP